jgi:hypothetical protein
MKAQDLATLHSNAIAAAKKASRWAYRTDYAGGPSVISCREPDSHTLHLTGLHSWNYAKHVGCSTRVGLAHLSKLAKAGLIVERKGWSGVRDFTLLSDEADALGREIIAELRAEGLQFEDDWRAQRKEKAGD